MERMHIFSVNFKLGEQYVKLFAKSTHVRIYRNKRLR